eukprot:11267634-Heterocapsa_arctica.AAC.1
MCIAKAGVGRPSHPEEELNDRMQGGRTGLGEGTRQGALEAGVPEPSPEEADLEGCGLPPLAEPRAAPVHKEGRARAANENAVVEPVHF